MWWFTSRRSKAPERLVPALLAAALLLMCAVTVSAAEVRIDVSKTPGKKIVILVPPFLDDKAADRDELREILVYDLRLSGYFELAAGIPADLTLNGAELAATPERYDALVRNGVELLVNLRTDYELLGFKGRILNLGFNHQSNGRSKPLSRSWNRLVANVGLEKENFNVLLKTWYRIPEDEQGDDNPDIIRYMGYGELRFLYAHRYDDFSFMIRNNLRKETKGAYEASWSHPVFKEKKNLRFYVQFFTGYGENLIDYNHANRRIGAGVMLNDWL